MAHPDSVTDEVRRSWLDGSAELAMSKHGQIRYFDLGGSNVAAYYWAQTSAGPTKGVIQLVHGHGSNMQYDFLANQGAGKPKTYEGSWVQKLNQAGFSVTGVDLPGLGRSEGLFGYCPGFDHYTGAVLRHASLLEHCDLPHFAGQPIFLLGISLGGCVAVHSAIKEPSRFQGVLLLAPMLSLDKVAKAGANPYLRPVANLLNWLVPTAPMAATNKNTLFPEIQADWDANPSTYHYKTRVRNACEYLRVCNTLMRSLPAVTFPFLVIHSSKDTMTDPHGSEQFYQGAKSADKSLVIVDNMWHVLVKEQGNEVLLQKCIDWMCLRTPEPQVVGRR